MKKLTVGVLAHVDAGKTTFCERVLALCGAVRTPGRVDHGDAFLDAHPIERRRGITVFSDQAKLSYEGVQLYLVDTPGHADFSPEMERAVSVMDVAVLLVSCVQGVQSHTETAWELLKQAGVPVFLFLNKEDREGADAQAVIASLRRQLSGDVLDARGYAGGAMSPSLCEQTAERDEALLERLFAQGYDESLWRDGLSRLVMGRAAFPAFSGSALKGEGIESFLKALCTLSETDWERKRDEAFRAQLYKIRHDAQGNRVCFFKALAGEASQRQEIALPEGTAKLQGLCAYHGQKALPMQRVEAGDLFAAAGLAGLKPGDIIGEGAAYGGKKWACEPMICADVLFDRSIPASRMLAALNMLEEEEGTLQVETREADGGIELRAMGAIQLEVLKELLVQRFGLDVSFGLPRIAYQETILAPCVGVGHYEPLRHYAEVWLRLVPTSPGSDVTFCSRCHVDTLALNWQKLIATHVMEKRHKGVLIGAPLTDVRVELLAGRAHPKHTEGGDFRQSVYRAMRNALMYAQSVLLEPISRFVLRAPSDCYGKLSSDLSRMRATVEAPQYSGERMTLRGEAPFASLNAYQPEFLAITHGKGALSLRFSRYAPCSPDDAQRIVESCAYQPLADDTPDSVFCVKGAGTRVAWDHVREWAHVQPLEDA